MTGDVDGNGIDDIAIGVYKESPLHQVMAKRPFIYSFDGKAISPLWRGSRLSRPFEDFILYDLDGDGICEIIASEYLEDRGMVINSYKWRGFGFEGYLQSDDVQAIKSLDLKKGELLIEITDHNQNIKAKIFPGDEKLEWREY
jgi:hypothetical protein